MVFLGIRLSQESDNSMIATQFLWKRGKECNGSKTVIGEEVSVTHPPG